ncbi:MAG: hydroxymethylbilane synthase, partial [Candidatus Eremiobacteraeota bacterium]|nr:hydroxymethylbilane synthase [Candidatus Eremiobacteraeota bacterium]
MSLPITLYLEGRLALIVGGGDVAARKAATLAEAGARVRVVAPHFDVRLMQTAGIELVTRAYISSDVEGAALVIAATNDFSVNARVVADARSRGVLVSDASEPERGDFAMPAVARIGKVSVAIETGGAAPALGKRLATDVREYLGDQVGAAAQTLARMRTYVQTVLPKERRGDVLRALGELPLEFLARMNPMEAEHEVEATISRVSGASETQTHAAVCATRASELAMIQARTVAAKLAQKGIATTLLTVTTTGDRIQDRALTAIGAESLFVKELELALRDARADYAVHSCKDLPSQLPPDMRIAAISAREDPRDVFCSERYATFTALPAGAIVGTSSLRRRAQLTALRGDVEYRDIRGNVDTRLRKLREGQYDAIVLASAGLRRLNVSARYTVAFQPEEIVPAVGQGALAVEVTQRNDELARRLREAVNDEPSELAILCERAALRRLQGGCQAPIGIFAAFDGAVLTVGGAVATLDGSQLVREI